MSSAVEARAATTPPAGLPPDSQIGTADPYSPRDPYGRSLLDPGSCDVSDWLGVSPAANGANDESGASGSGDAAPIPSGLSEARDLAMAYRSAIWLIDTRKQPLRQLVARVMREVHDALARGVTVDGLRAAKRMVDGQSGRLRTRARRLRRCCKRGPICRPASGRLCPLRIFSGCRRDNPGARACLRPLHVGPPQGDENSRRKCRVRFLAQLIN